MGGAERRVTAELCEWSVAAARTPLPERISDEALRALLNVSGTAVGAGRSDGVEAVLRYARDHGGASVAPLPGRGERLDPYLGAIATGLAGHYDDFDDTHLETVIHPAVSCFGALLGIGGTEEVSGTAALRAFAVGCEVQLRIGAAMSPDHYDEGWHITGTCGVLGAAVTAGLLLDLDARRLEQALGLAASQTVGLREGFGTMTKPLHPGRAAANGILAAKLAQEGFTGPDAVLERPGGYFTALTPKVDLARVADGLGTTWELLKNTYKPYPCGIVIHPAIDAAVAVSEAVDDPWQVDKIEIRCHPLVAELTGNPDPQDGLQSRFSAIHGVCAGLADGTVGLPQYDDARVRQADLVHLRARAVLNVDPQMARDAAEVVVTLDDGTRLMRHVAHAKGSADRPLTGDELRAKADALVEPVLAEDAARIAEAVARLAESESLDSLVAALTPRPAEKGSHE